MIDNNTKPKKIVTTINHNKNKKEGYWAPSFYS